MAQRKHIPFEVIGSIAVLQLPDKEKTKAEIFAKKILASNKHIKTVLLKTGRIKGRLRKRQLKIIAGVKTKETLHRENACLMKLNVETCYFSPRLSNERLEIAKEIAKHAARQKGRKKGKVKILVMFAGIAPYAIIIAKLNHKAKVIAIELNREACKYARENVKLNKLENLKIVQGDVKKITKNLKQRKEKFDFVVMPRPQLKETFLKEAFAVAKKHAMIYYYDFAKQQEIEKKLQAIEKKAKKARKKIKIVKVKKAGEIAPYRFRIRVDFKIL